MNKAIAIAVIALFSLNVFGADFNESYFTDAAGFTPTGLGLFIVALLIGGLFLYMAISVLVTVSGVIFSGMSAKSLIGIVGISLAVLALISVVLSLY